MSIITLTMANEQYIGLTAQAKHQKPIFVIGVIIVIKLNSKFIIEN
jgi:hypothetical protein